MEKATSVEKYDYYHLITGRDLPLLPQERILDFFDRNAQYEFISMKMDGALLPITSRIRYYYLFQDLLKDRGSRLLFPLKYLQTASVQIQKFLRVNRVKNLNSEFAYGSAYFDITDDLARTLVQQKETITKMYKFTSCADEIFLQSIYLNLPNSEKNILYSAQSQNSRIASSEMNIHRAIDWTKGSPYIWRIEDYDFLMQSGCFFARKFDYTVDSDIIEKIVNGILLENKTGEENV